MPKRNSRQTVGDPSVVLAKFPDGTTGDVRWITSESTTIRFANGRIHQPHLERSTQVSFRVAEGRRLATATGSDAFSRGAPFPRGNGALARPHRARGTKVPRIRRPEGSRARRARLLEDDRCAVARGSDSARRGAPAYGGF